MLYLRNLFFFSSLSFGCLSPHSERVKIQSFSHIILHSFASDISIFKQIESYNVVTSTIARGVAIGDELEYADEVTLGRSILHRIPFEQSLKGN